MPAKREPLVIVDLGAGRGEWLERIHRQLGSANNIPAKLSGADLSRESRVRRLLRSWWHERPRLVSHEPMTRHLTRFPDNSVDVINSDMALGYYTERGTVDTGLDSPSYGSESLEHLRRVARLAFEKLKPARGNSGGRNAYFSLRLQHKLNFRRVIEILEGVGFHVRTRDSTPREHARTMWLRRMHGYGNLVTVHAYKPAPV